MESLARATNSGLLLGGALGLWSLVQYVDFVRATTASKRAAHYAAACVLFGLALLSSPAASAVAPAAVLIDVLCLKTPLRRALWSSGPLLLAALFSSTWVTSNGGHDFAPYLPSIYRATHY